MRAGETPNTPLRLLAALLLFVFCGSALAGTATLTWDPVANPTVAGYMLHYGPAAGNYTAAVDAGKSTTRAVASLTEGATYHFVVTAYDASRTESSYSNDVAVTIPYAVPSASFSVSAVTGAAPLALNFNNTSSGTITSYAWAFGDGTTASVRSPSHVYSSPGLYSVSLTVSGPGGSNTKTIANLVTVIAPVDGSPPGAPSALVATAAGSSLVNLAWGAATDNVGVAGYRIERCAGAACTGFAQIATTSARTFADSGVVAATNYSYRVRATDAAGNAGAYSNVATATTATPSPTATGTTLKSTTNPSLAGASIVLTATVSGSAPSGTVQFTQNGTTIAGCGSVVLSVATRSATCASSALAIGHHAIVARYAGDATNGASSSASLDQVVTVAPGGSINVALAVNGGVASASSTLRPANDVKYVNDNKRSGAGWSTGGGGWADASPGQFPDWVQVVFAGARTIDHVVVYSVQDDYQHPAEPTATMSFTRYGITAFTVQGWNGAAWVTLGSVSGNTLVKRTVTFTPYTTDRIRVLVNGVADAAWSRITEIEAWTASSAATPANYALDANGGVATASSTLRAINAVNYVNDGQRSGAGWSTGGGGWADATSGKFPDWVQVAFSGSKTIDHVVVYSVQDGFQNPVAPTDSMTFSRYGVTAFEVQAWDGVAWVTLASVTGNNLVKRTVAFAPFTTDRIRVMVNGVADGLWSRIAEIEAWGT